MEASVLSRSRRPAGNTATGWLKIIALAFMFIDHSGKMLFPSVPEMRILGRIAFPVYVWCMIVGFHYTRSVPKYLLRVFLVGLASQPLYNMALGHTWSQPNVFLTLSLGLCALWGIREKKYGSQVWAPAAALILAVILGTDYGWRGVMLFILLYAVRDSRPGIAAVMTAFFLFWGTSYGVTKSLFGIPIDLNFRPDLPLRFSLFGRAVDLNKPIHALMGALSTLVSPFLRLETYALLSLPLILIPFGKDLKMPRWIGYLLYPAHLLLLWGLEQIFK